MSVPTLESEMGDSYRHEIAKRLRKSGWTRTRTVGRPATKEEVEKSAAIRWHQKKEKARQLKLW